MFNILNPSPLLIEENENDGKLGYVVTGLGHDPVILPDMNKSHLGLNNDVDLYCRILAHDTVEHMEKIGLLSTGELLWFDPYQSELVALGIASHNRPQDFRDLYSEIYQTIYFLMISDENPKLVDRSVFNDTDVIALDEMIEAVEDEFSIEDMERYLISECGGEDELREYLDYDDDDDERTEILDKYLSTAIEFYALGYLIASECRSLQFRFYATKSLFLSAYSTVKTTLEDGIDLYGAELQLSFDETHAYLELDFLDTVGIEDSWDNRWDDDDNDSEDDTEGDDDAMTSKDKAISMLGISETTWIQDF